MSFAKNNSAENDLCCSFPLWNVLKVFSFPLNLVWSFLLAVTRFLLAGSPSVFAYLTREILNDIVWPLRSVPLQQRRAGLADSSTAHNRSDFTPSAQHETQTEIAAACWPTARCVWRYGCCSFRNKHIVLNMSSGRAVADTLLHI